MAMLFPTAIIKCPDCGIECNYVANNFYEMPTSYPGDYHPHQKGSRSCLERHVENLERQVENLKREVEQQSDDRKYIVCLWSTDRYAVVIDSTPEDAVRRAQLYEPGGGWEHASIEIVARTRSTRTSRVLALERLDT